MLLNILRFLVFNNILYDKQHEYDEHIKPVLKNNIKDTERQTCRHLIEHKETIMNCIGSKKYQRYHNKNKG